MVEVRALAYKCQHIAASRNSKVEGPPPPELADRDSLGNLPTVRKFDLCLPVSVRLAPALQEMDARHAASIVGPLLLMELAKRKCLRLGQFPVAPPDRRAQRLRGAAVLRLVETPVMEPSPAPEVHRPVPRSPLCLKVLDGVGRLSPAPARCQPCGHTLIAPKRTPIVPRPTLMIPSHAATRTMI